MDVDDVTRVVEEVIGLVGEHYVDVDAAPVISQVVAAALAEGRYGGEPKSLADAVTADLQSVNGDRHLRLLYHADPLDGVAHGDEDADWAAMTRWAEQTCGGVARVERLPGNVGYLDVQPVLFPAPISGDAITAGMSLVASTEALIIDLRSCIGGEPTAAAYLCSYLFGREPVELTGLYERASDRVRQSWTLPFVPGRRFGATKPVYLLTSAATFSGGEQVSYDLQQQGRAVVIGARTRGGAHAREGFRVHPHLEATISVARAVSPVTGGNWEGTGVTPDIEVPAERARDRAYRLALEHVAAQPGALAEEAGEALADLAGPDGGSG
jgi:Peptidase family S41/N-terminal domain of Peptidase_S41 in eukaryotic IRBP